MHTSDLYNLHLYDNPTTVTYIDCVNTSKIFDLP